MQSQSEVLTELPDKRETTQLGPHTTGRLLTWLKNAHLIHNTTKWPTEGSSSGLEL